jgi:hypothetical protein
VHGTKNVRQTEMHTAELLVPNLVLMNVKSTHFLLWAIL